MHAACPCQPVSKETQQQYRAALPCSFLQDVGPCHPSVRLPCMGAQAAARVQVFGGLIVGMVVKYADNILKNFANAVSVILTVLFAVPLFGQARAPEMPRLALESPLKASAAASSTSQPVEQCLAACASFLAAHGRSTCFLRSASPQLAAP